jgi:hypothetical protein
MRRIFPTLLVALFLCAGLSGRQQDTSTGSKIHGDNATLEAVASVEAESWNPRLVAVPVRDVDNPGRNPFQTSFEQVLQFLLPDAESTFTVPEGRRLVIEHVSVLAQGQASASAPWGLSCAVSTTANGGEGRLLVTLAPVGFQAGINQVSAGNLYAAAYADGGSTVRTVCTRVNFSSRSVAVQISIIGHLVDERRSTDRSALWNAPRVSVPVPVRDLDNPGLNPFQRSFHVDALTADGVTVAVPNAKRLVIEQISLQTIAAGAVVCTVSTTADGSPAALFMPSAAALGIDSTGTSQVFIGSGQVRAYADSGSGVNTRCFGLGGSGGTAAADVSIIGHLVRR